MQKIKTRDLLGYTLFPRFFPRIKHLFFSGFGYLSLLIAHIYAIVRLLPSDHPYLDSKNVGRFGVRHVVAEAARNLKFSRQYMDQVVVFFVILSGLVLLVLQLCILVYSLVSGQAFAFSWFDTADPATDVAFTLMDRVFGLPGVFCSSVTPANCTDYSADTNGPGPGAPVIPTPFHTALHALFRFYSQALLLIAMMIFLYFVVVIVVETAVTGTPFGQRFQNVWVPVRLVAAIGLLFPVGAGLNSGQWITIYAAKFGSSFATSGWRGYNQDIGAHSLFSGVPLGADEVAGNPLGQRYNLLAIPPVPDVSPVIGMMALVHTCAYLYHKTSVGLSANRTNSASGPPYPETPANLATYGYVQNNSLALQRVAPYLVKMPTAAMTASLGNTLAPGLLAGGRASYAENRVELSFTAADNNASFLEALGFYYGGDIIIRFGEYIPVTDSGYYKNELGNVKPLCGDVRIPVTNLQDPNGFTAGRGGASYMQNHYYRMILDMWFNRVQMQQFARIMGSAHHTTPWGVHENICNPAVGGVLTGTGTPGLPATQLDCTLAKIGAEWRAGEITHYAASTRTAILRAWQDNVTGGFGRNMTNEILNLGWGGAGVWFTKVSDLNGTFIESVNALPALDQYPVIMQEIRDAKIKLGKNVSGADAFVPNFIADKNTVLPKLKEEYGEQFGKVLSLVYEHFYKMPDLYSQKTPSANVLTNAMDLLLGTSGLLAIRTSNRHIHPLAQLTAVGKSLVESAVRNIAMASLFSFGGGLLSASGDKDLQAMGSISNVLSEALLAATFMSLTAGFVLFYVLPILPFVYFFFAVGGWVKAIFEAMVGVPLWALAHMRIDGDGLPGDAAQNGYFLILEIFIRPILTLFGLIAAISIFTVQVYTLNFIWDLVTANATGFEAGTDILLISATADLELQRGPIDKFFFTIIYTIICYMMALASFKLIDNIPDNILRWAGAGVSSFGDIDKDHVEALNRYAAMGGMTIGSQATSAVVGLSGGVGKGIGVSLREAVKPSP